MNDIRKAFILHALAAGVLLALNLAPAEAAEPVHDSWRARALVVAAARYGIAVGDLVVLNAVEAQYPGTDVTLYKAKLRGPAGQVLGVALDASGVEVGPARLAELEQASRGATRIHPLLAQAMDGASTSTPLAVIVWLHEPDQAAVASPDAQAARDDSRVEAARAQADRQRAAMIEHVAAPVLASLRELDPQARVHRYSPAIFARLTPAAIARVAARADVAAVYEDAVNRPELDTARQVIQADTVQNAGITGAGLQIAQIEVGGRVATANPYLVGLIQDNTFVCAAPSAHSSGVAGILHSNHPTVRGIAVGSTLWAGGSCAGTTNELYDRSTAAADWGASAINLSWGSNTNLVPGADDRFYDDMVINRWRTVVKSAGNEAGTCGSRTGNVTSPGLAYNVITVGNFDDRNTVAWPDDLMDSCSSWKNPASFHNDRQKPEVAAPGSTINSTTIAAPWTGDIGSGTSFAAPMVTGIAALMMQRNPALKTWPEAVKAILMTTAEHNIEGDTRLSDLDGAGGVVASAADQVAGARRIYGLYGWEARAYDCNAATDTDVAVMMLFAGFRTRATIVWDQNPDYLSYGTQPSADLDLDVIPPYGAAPVASSASYDNTYEIVEFTPPVTGNYTLRVHKFRCGLTPKYLAYAWRQN